MRLLTLACSMMMMALLGCPKKDAASAEAPAHKAEAETAKPAAPKAEAPASVPAAAGSMPADMHHAEAAAGDDKTAEDAPVVFDKKPAVGTKAKCPVTKEVFAVTDKTVCSEHEGKFYCHCCPGCESKFKADPAKYLNN